MNRHARVLDPAQQVQPSEVPAPVGIACDDLVVENRGLGRQLSPRADVLPIVEDIRAKGLVTLLAVAAE